MFFFILALCLIEGITTLKQVFYVIDDLMVVMVV